MQTAVARRFRTQSLSTLGLYFVVFTAVFFYVERYHPGGFTLWIFAVAAAIPLLLTFVLMGRYLAAETDGYKREITVRSLLWGVAMALGVHLVESFARTFGSPAHLPPFSELYVFAFSMVLAKLAYRIANGAEADA